MKRINFINREEEYIFEKWNGKEPVVLGYPGDCCMDNLGVLIPMGEWRKYQDLKKAIIKLGVEVLYDGHDEDQNLCC